MSKHDGHDVACQKHGDSVGWPAWRMKLIKRQGAEVEQLRMERTNWMMRMTKAEETQ